MEKERLREREWMMIFLVMTAIIACGVVSAYKRRTVEALCHKKIELQREYPQKGGKKRRSIKEI